MPIQYSGIVNTAHRYPSRPLAMGRIHFRLGTSVETYVETAVVSICILVSNLWAANIIFGGTGRLVLLSLLLGCSSRGNIDCVLINKGLAEHGRQLVHRYDGSEVEVCVNLSGLAG